MSKGKPNKPPKGWQSQYARHAGITPQAVYYLVNRGLDFSSFEAADAWRIANQSQGVGHRSKENNAAPDMEAIAAFEEERANLESLSDEGLLDLMSRTAVTERTLHAALQVALKDVNSQDHETAMKAMNKVTFLSREHTKASKARVDIESQTTKVLKERGSLVPIENALRALKLSFEPGIAALKNMPDVVSGKLTAETVSERKAILVDAINPIIKLMRTELERNGHIIKADK